jgi:hypothetical protein
MRDALIDRILTLAETLVQTRWAHRCTDGNSCTAVDFPTVAALEAAIKELREADDAE